VVNDDDYDGKRAKKIEPRLALTMSETRIDGDLRDLASNVVKLATMSRFWKNGAKSAAAARVHREQAKCEPGGIRLRSRYFFRV
jgi:hypothetical protein